MVIPIEIPPNAVMFKGISLDSNIYLVRDGDEVLLVDTGTGGFFNSYKAVVEREMYLFEVSRAIILNTHEHFDHIGGNWLWKEYLESLGIKVLFASHENTSKILEKGDDHTILSYYYGRHYKPHKVDIKLKDGDHLRIGSLELEVIHTPGHTSGSICLYEPNEMLLFTGDTVFYHTVGRTDMPTGNFEDLMKSIERLREFQVYIGLPGHGRIIQNWKENMKIIKRLIDRYI